MRAKQFEFPAICSKPKTYVTTPDVNRVTASEKKYFQNKIISRFNRHLKRPILL